MGELFAFAGFVLLVVASSRPTTRPRPRPDDDDDDDDEADLEPVPDPDDYELPDFPRPPVPPWNERPLWPLPGVDPEGKPTAQGKFGTYRGRSKLHPEWGAKLHPGVDLYAPHLSPIVAPEHGMIVATQGWDGPGAKALVFQTARKDGPALLIGAIEPGSAAPEGIFFARGTVIAKVGMYPKGSTMLHIEAYERGTTHNYKWFANLPRPERLLDITPYIETMVQADGS